LVYAGRAGTGIDYGELERLWRRLQPLAIPEMPLDAPPRRDSRFGSPLTLSRVHWVRPELVAEVKFLSWTEDNLLRQVVYEGLREDKPAAEVRRAVPYPKPPEPARPTSRPKRPRSGRRQRAALPGGLFYRRPQSRARANRAQRGLALIFPPVPIACSRRERVAPLPAPIRSSPLFLLISAA